MTSHVLHVPPDAHRVGHVRTGLTVPSAEPRPHEPGDRRTALVFTRYDEEKAVVLNPQDFHRLSALDHDLEELSSDRPALSELALEAHALEDRPGRPDS